MIRRMDARRLPLPSLLPVILLGCGSPMPSPSDTPVPSAGAPAFVFVAYRSELAAYHQDPQTGALTPAARTPWTADQVPSADPGGRFLFASEGGQVTAWRVHADGSVTRGASSVQGPGRLHPNGRFAYRLQRVLGPCEQDGYGSTSVLDAADGGITEVRDGAFVTGVAPHEIALGAAGRFAYVANTGDLTDRYSNCRAGSISAYAVDQGTGRLSPMGAAFAPGRAHSLMRTDAEGRRLFAAQVRDYGNEQRPPLPAALSLYAIDPAGGGLSQAPQGVLELPSRHVPWSLAVEPQGRLAFLSAYIEDGDVDGVGEMLLYTLLVGAQGQLTPLGEPQPWGLFYGKAKPRALRLHPDGRFAYVHVPESSRLLVARVDAARGLVESAAPPVALGTDALGIVVFTPRAE